MNFYDRSPGVDSVLCFPANFNWSGTVVKLGQEITEEVSGSAGKTVQCETCDEVYAYSIERQGVGEGFRWFFSKGHEAKAEAAERANRDLQDQLNVGADLVPCPRCGHCQSDMVDAAREKQHRWMSVPIMISAIVFLYALPLSLSGEGKIPLRDRMILGYLAAAMGTVAFGLAVLQSWLRKRYDPNTSPLADRLEISRARCLNTDYGHVCSAIARTTGSSLSPEDEHGTKSVSSSDQHSGVVFLWFTGITAALGVILMGSLPADQKWRALAAFAMSGLFLIFSVKFFSRKT